MIDWFASKIGILVFIVASLSILMFFVSMQVDIMDQGKKVSAANDLARLSDGLCDGCSIYYSFGRNYTVGFRDGNVTIEGIERAVLSSLTDTSMNVDAVIIRREGGKVTLHGA